MITRKKKKKWLYFILVVFLLVFPLLSVYCLHTQINLTSYKGILIPQIEKATGLNIELEEVGLTILPYPRLSLRDLAIIEGEDVVLKAKSVNASLALIPLLFRKEFEVKNLTITGSDIFVKREAGGGLNIIRILKQTSIPVSIKKAKIKKGKAHFTDEFLQKEARYEAADIDATLVPKGAADFSYSGTAKFLPYAEIKFSGETKNSIRDFEGSAVIKGVDIERIRPYLSGAIPGERFAGEIGMSFSYQISEKPLYGALDAAKTFKQISIKGNAAYYNLTASMPSLFDKPISSSQGIFGIEVESNTDVLKVSIPKAQLYFHDFIAFADLKFERGKDSNGKLVLNLSTTRMPLVSIKEQFFISLLPDATRKELNRTSFQSGQIKISNLKIAGNIKDIKEPDYYKNPGSLSATIEADDAEFSHRDLNRNFSMMSGVVKWEDGGLKLYGIAGKYGKSVLERLDGSAAGMLDTPLLQINGRCMLDAEEAKDELKAWLSKKSKFKDAMEGFAVDGVLPLSFRLSGKIGAQGGLQEKGLALSIDSDATSTDFVYLPWIKKAKGFKTAIDVDLLIKHDSISVETAKINFGSSELGIKGLLNFNQDTFYKLNLTALAMRLDDIDEIIPYLKKELASKGSLSAILDISKEDSQKFPNIKGAVSLRNGEFETGFLPKRVSDVNMTASFYGDSAAIIVNGMKIGNSFLSGNVTLPDIKTANVDFNFDSPYLDYEDIYLSRGEYYDKGLEGISITGNGKVSAKEARVAGFHVKSLQADALLKPDEILLKAVFIKDNGKGVGNFVYTKDRGVPFAWKLSIDASGVGMESLFKEIGAREKILSGDADIKMELSVRKGEGEIAKRIDGKADIHAKNGRLWKFVALSKVFSIVNIISIDELFRDGLPYKTLTGNFVIEDGGIATENLLLDSSSMRMSAIGVIDISSMTIDAKLGIHPFVTVDKIITNIPLAGWIIGGKEKSTISMYYTIKGRLRDPEVEAIPIQAMGEGVFGIFKRILELPLDAVEPLVR